MRMTRHTLTILRHLLSAPDQHHHGYQIIQATRYTSAVVYPTLTKLLEAGWLTSHDEPRTGPSGEVYGRPIRRYYQLTDLGRQRAQEELAKAQAEIGGQ